LQVYGLACNRRTFNSTTRKVITMKRFYKSIAVIVLLLPVSMFSMAAEPQGADMPPKEMGMQHGMGMMGGMTEEQKTEHMRNMQEHMLQMHDLSNQILAEKDPAKKEALKKQQLDLMKAHHAQMRQHRQQKMQERKK
jgi:hypothetical protein